MLADSIMILIGLLCMAANVVRKDYVQAFVWLAVSLYALGQLNDKRLKRSKYDY